MSLRSLYLPNSTLPNVTPSQHCTLGNGVCVEQYARHCVSLECAEAMCVYGGSDVSQCHERTRSTMAWKAAMAAAPPAWRSRERSPVRNSKELRSFSSLTHLVIQSTTLPASGTCASLHVPSLTRPVTIAVRRSSCRVRAAVDCPAAVRIAGSESDSSIVVLLHRALGVLGCPFSAACATHQCRPPGLLSKQRSRSHQGVALGDDPPCEGPAL